MEWIKGLIAKLIGKDIRSTVDADLVKFGISKTKVIAVIAALIPAITPISTALGHPIIIPDTVYKVLAGLGLWALRDSTATTPTNTPLN